LLEKRAPQVVHAAADLVMDAPMEDERRHEERCRPAD
jgi:hypothetical protein